METIINPSTYQLATFNGEYVSSLNIVTTQDIDNGRTFTGWDCEPPKEDMNIAFTVKLYPGKRAFITNWYQIIPIGTTIKITSVDEIATIVDVRRNEEYKFTDYLARTSEGKIYTIYVRDDESYERFFKVM